MDSFTIPYVPADSVMPALVQVIGVPTGRVHQANNLPGPLDGQPEHRWYTRTVMLDGKERVFPELGQDKAAFREIVEGMGTQG